jgi:hypothetical protein
MTTTTQTPSGQEAVKFDGHDIEPKYTEAEEYYNKKSRDLLITMVNERGQKRPQFNDMTFDQWDDKNIKADLSYIPPARNKGDTRIVTGMTREKDSSLLSLALSYDFVANFIAYDKQNRIINEITEDIEDMVDKSFNMELYEDKKSLYYRGIISRGSYYVMDLWVEKYGYEKALPSNYIRGSLQATWTEKIKKTYAGCETVGLDPKKVYVSDMKEFFIQNQDAVAIVDRISYEGAYEIYQDWERWENVPKDFSSIGCGIVTETGNLWTPYWSLTEIKKNEVERVILMKKKTNELQIFLNGVSMLPVVLLGKHKNLPVVSGFPLTCISPCGDYPIVKGDAEAVDGFGIGKAQPAKMQVDQEVQDEFLKMMILKTKQSFWPPMANNSGKALSRSNFMPSVITNDIKKDSVYPIIESQGVTTSEFSFYQLLKNMMEDKSTTAQFDGSQEQNMTATAVIENKKQQLMKLGLTLDGITRFERDLRLLRLKNGILTKWTQAEDTQIDKVKGAVKEIFRTVSIDKSKYSRRQKSQKVIQFTKNVAAMQEQDPKGYKIHEMEEKNKKETGIESRYSFIDPDILRNLGAIWYCVIIPNDKKDDTLSRMVFVQNIEDAQRLFGPQSLEVEKLKQRFAAVIGEDYSVWFKEGEGLETLMAGAGQQLNNPNTLQNPTPKPTLKNSLGLK